MQRRTFIAAAGASAAASIAGCSSILGGGGDSDTESSEAVAEAFVEASYEGNSDEAEDLIHPEATFSDGNNQGGQSEFEGSVNSIETSVEVDDFTADDVTEYEQNFITVSQETVSSVAENEELELVRTTVEVESQGRTAELEIFVLAATDGDEWLVLDIGIGAIGGMGGS